MESSRKAAPCSKCDLEIIARCKARYGNGRPPCAEMVEEKFTSTNKQSTPCSCGKVIFYVYTCKKSEKNIFQGIPGKWSEEYMAKLMLLQAKAIHEEDK